jgi:hypothetical protein
MNIFLGYGPDSAGSKYGLVAISWEYGYDLHIPQKPGGTLTSCATISSQKILLGWLLGRDSVMVQESNFCSPFPV